MYMQKRKSLVDRINQVVHQMTGIPEEQVFANIHLEFNKANGDEKAERLPADEVRMKRERIIVREESRDFPKTENCTALINLYEELIVIEDTEQEQKDEAYFKQSLLQYQMHLKSLLLAQGGYLTSLLSEKQCRTDDSLRFPESDAYSRKEYSTPRLLVRTEDQIALYNREVEKSRKELKNIAKRYSSDVLNRWEQEFLHELEEERRQIQMTLN